MQHNLIAAAPGTRAAYVSESEEIWYLPVIGWVQGEAYENGCELAFNPIVYDPNFPSEASCMGELTRDSKCFVRIFFNNEELDKEAVRRHAASLRQELERDAELAEKSRVVRRQIGKILLASYPEPLSKPELIERGVTSTDGILAPLLQILKVGGLIEESTGAYRLTERGVVQAKAAADVQQT
jgi:hypothetical protein